MSEKNLAMAIEVAATAHRNQVRKGTDTPYIVHPFSVGMILAKAGCEDKVIVAGILHDTIEDTSLTFQDIKKLFGEVVAEIVKGASEPDKSLPWEDRKRHTIKFLESAPLEILLVVCADKLDNVRSISCEHRRIGEKVWDRFKKGRQFQSWYYLSITRTLARRMKGSKYVSLADDLTKEVVSLFGSQ